MAAPQCALGKVFATLGVVASVLATQTSVAEAPKGHFTVNGEVVQDTATKLVWQRAVPAKSYTSDQASAYCAGLKLAGGGWRLPTIKELHTLVDETRTVPAIDDTAFPETPPYHFWTSSHLSEFPQFTWSINFAEGTDAWFPGENEQRVRCVR